ncbi:MULTISPECIES: hypothetical protein [Pseudomonas]|uniref:Transmembrane sensor/regulator PpyR n=1 Tax=Pseudomonas fluorescens LMG 5329 TaxID=1324332 RepID=A0A0A1Z0A1_PSEFL|nr:MULTISPECIES: hypothetical protein [Pseudomonas]KGE67618.1 transmembrane sensor/regulator PpyR [Pseudomonas fluorescens LMG 5329]NWE04799.1 transmembrane sensor/regulator PpyR [Pseudomonas sp. IPO3749]NWF24566.1 transmembrane sensor/regulator PpyR [Pseudomonas sp. IPO3749]
MLRYFDSPLRVLSLGNSLLLLGLGVLLLGILLAYWLDQRLPLLVLVLAHGMTILGPTLIKIGYVMRLLSQYKLGNDRGVLAHAF